MTASSLGERALRKLGICFWHQHKLRSTSSTRTGRAEHLKKTSCNNLLHCYVSVPPPQNKKNKQIRRVGGRAGGAGETLWVS